MNIEHRIKELTKRINEAKESPLLEKEYGEIMNNLILKIEKYGGDNIEKYGGDNNLYIGEYIPWAIGSVRPPFLMVSLDKCFYDKHYRFGFITNVFKSKKGCQKESRTYEMRGLIEDITAEEFYNIYDNERNFYAPISFSNWILNQLKIKKLPQKPEKSILEKHLTKTGNEALFYILKKYEIN